MAYCLIFPGQGTQFPGMAQGLELEGVDPELVRLMQEGPEERLQATIHAQPAVLAVSVALWRRSGLDQPAMVMGHSLGEYTALTVAGVFDTTTALDVVRRRAALMEQAPQGVMAAVMGLSAADLQTVLDETEGVWLANYNGANQLVISGQTAAVHAVIPVLKAKGAKVIPLKLTVASHSPLMAEAACTLKAHLALTPLHAPRCPVVFNASAQSENDPAKIKDLLVRQLSAPVLWEQSVQYALACGIDHFIEIGPKSVLAGLIRRIAPAARVESHTSTSA